MSIQELLGLPPDVTQPNAYQLFGLELGESDQTTINAAVSRKVASLKQSKSQVPPEIWKRAARAVQKAHQTLGDPLAKAELDASFGIVNEPVSAAPTNPDSNPDPLASLLPSASGAANPPAPVAPSDGHPVVSVEAVPEARAASQGVTHVSSEQIQGPPNLFAEPHSDAVPTNPPPPMHGSPAGGDALAGGDSPARHDSPLHDNPGAAAPRATAPVVQTRQPIRRRRSYAGMLFGTIAMLLMAMIVGVMGYFFVYGPGEVQFVKTDDGFQIKTGNQAGSSQAVATPRPTASAQGKPKSDGIMKPPSPVGSAPKISLGNELDAPLSPNGAGMNPGPGGDQGTGMMTTPSSSMPDLGMSSMTTPPMSATPATDPGSSSPGSESPAPAPAPVPAPTPAPAKPPTDAEISIGQVAIKTAIDAVRTAQWDSMKTLAEMAEAKAVTPDQKEQAKTVFQYADLATFYRGGIRKALAELPANSEIKVTETMRVLVNEADEEHLKINLGKDGSGKPRYRNYLIDELPLVLAHELARYQVDVDSSEGQAAKAAFQAIASLATPGHREESVRIFRGLNQVEGADPQRLADFLETLGQ